MFETGLQAIFEEKSCSACREGNCSQCEYLEEVFEANQCAHGFEDQIYISPPRCACFLSKEKWHWETDYTQDRTWKDNVSENEDKGLPEMLDPPYCPQCMGTDGFPECQSPMSHAVQIFKRPTKQREGDQPLPDGGGQCVQDEVISALQAAIHQIEQSKKVGLERYGSLLRTFNGRRGIQDVVEEARDLFVYLTQVSLEVDASEAALKAVVVEALEKANSTLTSFYLADSATTVTVANMIVSRILTSMALRQEQAES